MFKKIALLLALSFSVYGKDFSEQIIQIQPVSWDELQLLQLDTTKSIDELNISRKCPSDLPGFEKLEYKGTFLKEILWTKYIWSEFQDKNEKKCLIKHQKMDFFSLQGQDLDKEKYEIFSPLQSQVFLSAAESIGFDEKGIEILSHHIRQHNQAIKEKPFLKYGGIQNVIRFKNNNEPDLKININDSEKTFLEAFEAQYSKETLQSLQNEVAKNGQTTKENKEYPFNSFSELLKAVKRDMVSLKDSKKKEN